MSFTKYCIYYTSEWDKGILLKLVLKLWEFIVEYCTSLTAGGGLVTMEMQTGWGLLYQQFSSLSLVMTAGGRSEGRWRGNSNCAYSLNWLLSWGLADKGGAACAVFILEG